MHLIVQGGKSDTAGIVKTLNPLAIYHMGEVTDQLYHNGELDNVKEWCKKARQLGVMVGVGSHYPKCSPRSKIRAGTWISSAAASTTACERRTSGNRR